MTILSIVAFSIVVLVVYNVLKTYVLYKVKVNKWVILGLAMILFVVPMLVWPAMPKYVANYVIPGIFVFLFLWFMDLSGFIKKRNVSKTNYTSTNTKKDKKDDIVMRPKAKPNRIKNNNNNKK
jgi:CDP-diglyceride synthetase